MKAIIAISVVVIISTLTYMTVQAEPNQQVLPECSIQNRDSGDSIDADGAALVTPLQNLRVTCDVRDNSEGTNWDFSTELLNPKWSVSDEAGRRSPVFEQTINLKGYSDILEIELTGNVAWPRVPSQFGSEEAAYISEIAPGIRTRVVSFSGQSSAAPVHYEIISVHPDHIRALDAINSLDGRDPLISQYVSPIRDVANSAIEDGRPWRAIEIIEAMDPVLDIATEHRLEYQELSSDSQSFMSPQLFAGIGIGIVAIAVIGGFVVLILFIRTRRNDASNREQGDTSDDSSVPAVSSEDTEPTATSGRRRRRRRRSQ